MKKQTTLERKVYLALIEIRPYNKPENNLTGREWYNEDYHSLTEAMMETVTHPAWRFIPKHLRPHEVNKLYDTSL